MSAFRLNREIIVAGAVSALVGATAVLRPGLAAVGVGVVVAAAAVAYAPMRRAAHVRLNTYAWLPVAWTALIFASSVKLSGQRSPLDAASGKPSLDNLVELAVYAVIGLAVVTGWTTSRQIEQAPLVIRLYPAWVAAALLSSAWSIVPLFSLVRASQLCVVVLLALFTARVCTFAPQLREEILSRTLRLFIGTVAALTVTGFVVREWPEGRFAWPGTHELVVALILGSALLVLLASGPRFLRISLPLYCSCIGLFSAALLIRPTRTALIALIVCFPVTLWLINRRRTAIRRLTTASYAFGVAAVAFFFFSEIIDYLTRGESYDPLTTLNGRLPLWHVAIDQLQTPQDWLFGFGFGSSRVLLSTQVEWGAGEAHNAWIELLLSAGLVGVALAFGGIIFIARDLLWRLSGPSSSAADRVGGTLFIYLLVTSMTTPSFALPGFASALFALAYSQSLIRVPYGDSLAVVRRPNGYNRETGTVRPSGRPAFAEPD